MTFLVFLVPFMSFLATLLLYRHNGKKEFLKLDFVQFVYGFVIYPLMFVWLKSFLFLLLKSEFAISLSINEIFVYDTAFTTLLLYLYAFVVIHSLTKSFNLRYYRDPLYDIFEHSEYYHLWLTHVMVFVGVLGTMTLISFANILLPLDWQFNTFQFYSLLATGFVLGMLGFAGVWLSDPQQAQFMRLMKLVFGLFFLLHVGIYFIFDPPFSSSRGMYWFMFMACLATVCCSYLFHRSKKAVKLIDRFKHHLWEKKLLVLTPD